MKLRDNFQYLVLGTLHPFTSGSVVRLGRAGGRSPFRALLNYNTNPSSFSLGTSKIKRTSTVQHYHIDSDIQQYPTSVEASLSSRYRYLQCTTWGS